MLKKIASIFTGITVICWLSGLALLVPLPVQAVTVNEGDLIRGPDGIKVYIVNAFGYRRHIYNPDVFNIYAHLKWENIKEVDQATLDSYTVSDLYRADVEHQVYSVGEDGIKHWLNMTAEEFVTEGYSWNQVFVVNATEGAYYTVGSELTVDGDEPVATAGLSIALADDSPVATAIPQNTQDLLFSKINFTAGADQDYTVSSVYIRRGGLSADADITSVKLYDGATQLGSTQALNTTTHKASFTGLSWVIPAGTTKVLLVKGSTQVVGSGAVAGDLISFGIYAAVDVSATVTPTGMFPIYGNTMTLAGQAVGTFTIDAQSTPAGTVISGSTDQAVAAWKFTSASEGFDLHSVTFTEVGSSVDADVSNLKLMYGATQLGSTLASLTNGKAVFDLSASPYYVKDGANKILTLYVDISSNVTTARIVRFEITQASHVVAYGVNSGGGVDTAGTYPERGEEITIGQGTLTVTKDTAYAPSAQDYVLGQEQVDVNAYKFSAGATEGVRIVKIRLQLVGANMEETDIANVNLVDAITGEIIAGPASAVSDYITYGSNTEGLDSPGLFDIPASGNRHIMVKADIPTGADDSNDFGVELADATTDVLADGLVSAGDLSSTDITDSTGTDAITHDLNEKGTLTIAAAGVTPTADTYSLGVVDYSFAKFDLTAGMEDMLISALNIDFSDHASSGTYDILSVDTDFTNVDLYDGDTLLDSDATLSSGVANFNISFTIPRDTTKTLTIKADIPAGSTAGRTATVWIGNSATTDYQDNITTTGVSSGQDVDESGTNTALHGNLMTAGTPSVAVSMGTTPAAKNVMSNASMVHIGTMYLDTANSSEDVKMTRIRISFADQTSGGDLSNGAGNGSSANTDLSNVKLFEHGTSNQIGTTQPSITNVTDDYDYVDFSGLSFTILKGTSKALDVKVDVEGSSGDYYVGWENHTTADFSGIGVDSGTDLANDTVTDGGNGSGKAMSIQSSGSLAITEYADTPLAGIVIAGTTLHEFSKFKFAATDEAIILKALRVEIGGSGGMEEDFAKVYIYHEGSVIGSGYIASTTADIIFDTQVTVEKDSSEVLTIVADINSIAVAGNITGDAPTLAIDYNYTSGYWSGTSPNYSSKAAVEMVGIDSNTDIVSANDVSGSGNGQTVYASKLTAVASSATPSGSMLEGTAREIFRLDLTCADNVGHYDCTLETLKVTFSKSLATVDNFKLYRADTGSQLGSTIPGSLNDNTVLFTLTSAYTIPYGTTKVIYVKGGMHMEGAAAATLAGNLEPSIAILGGASTTGHLAWKEGKYASNITWIDVPGASEITGGMFTYTNGTDTYQPRLAAVSITTDTGTAGYGNQANDVLTLYFTEPVTTAFGSAAAPTAAELDAIFDRVTSANAVATTTPFANGVFTCTDYSSTDTRTIALTETGGAMTTALLTSHYLQVNASPTANDIEDLKDLDITASAVAVDIDVQ